MNQILPHPLWVGHAGDGRDVNALVDAGIELVVQLAIDEPPPMLPRELKFCRIPLHDGSENDPHDLQFAVDVIAGALARQVATLVCCSAGASRSPAVAACALSVFGSESQTSCLELVRQYHRTDVSPALWHDLTRLVEDKR